MATIPKTSAQTRTSHGLTIYSDNGRPIGLIQSWAPTATRQITPVYELNKETSGDPVDNVPGNVQNLTMQVTRYDIYGALMETAFGTRDLTWLGNQNVPFRVVERWEDPDEKVRRYEYSGCWFNQLGRTVQSTGDRLVQVQATLTYLKKRRI